jgi:triphosphatase
VQRYLPLAARHDADDVEYVHQLRVSCRRAAAAMRSFEELAGRHGRPLKKWLRRLRQAAGPARDADVYLERLRLELDPANDHARQLVDFVRQTRVDAQAALIKVDAKAGRGGLQQAIDECLEEIGQSENAGADESFAAVAQEQVAAAAKELSLIDPQTATLEELHEMRILSKRLRYAIEIFHSAAAPELRLMTYPVVEEIQEQLGALNDRHTSQARLQRWLADMPADGLGAFVAELVVHEHATALRIRGQFLEWWTRARQDQLADELAAAFA